MPNGDPDWEKKERPILEKFFEKISKVLSEFANSHNLMIEKYYHQGPGWSLMFRHPKGGRAQIEVGKSSDDSVVVSPSWWIDDYENATRWWKYLEGEKSSLDHNALRTILEDMFKLIISWNKGDLKAYKSKYYNNWKKHYSKEEFKRQEEKYPTPKLD